MLFVTFKAGGTRFALPAHALREITPLVEVAPLPGAPPYIPGLMNHRGSSLPVVDLTMLLAGSKSRPWMSTRIMIAEPERGLSAGFMAERVLKTKDIALGAITAPGAPAAPYVLGVTALEEGLVQVLELARVLPPELLASLKAAQEAA